MNYFKHESALVETDSIGDGTRIDAFVHVLAGATIGRDCQISDHVFVGADASIGNNSIIRNGVQLWAGTRIEDDVFVGPNATLADGGLPRASAPGRPRHITIRRGAAIGANATIFPGVTIGESARVGAGAVVTLDVPPHAIV